MKPKSLYITLSVLMIGLVALVYSVLTLHERSRSDALMLQQASVDAQRIGRDAAAAVDAELRPARVSVGLLASSVLSATSTQAQRLDALPALSEVLRGNASV